MAKTESAFGFEEEILWEPLLPEPPREPKLEEVQDVAGDPGSDERARSEAKAAAIRAQRELTEADHRMKVALHPALKGVTLGYRPASFPERLKIQQSFYRLADEKDWDRVQTRATALMVGFWVGWHGVTPAVMRALLPKRTSEQWAEKQLASLASENKTEFDFSPAALKELCEKSEEFFRLARQTVDRAMVEANREEVREGNG